LSTESTLPTSKLLVKLSPELVEAMHLIAGAFDLVLVSMAGITVTTSAGASPKKASNVALAPLSNAGFD
jgi:hypothetical protein